MTRRHVEFFVCVLLVTAVSALVTSLIVRARESASRTSCANNLKQLAIGAHNYHDLDGSLPQLTEPKEGLWSVFATLAPFIEADHREYHPDRAKSAEAYHAHSSVGFRFRGKDGDGEFTQHGGDANQLWRLFLDPADPTPKGLRDIPMTLPNGTVGYYATGNYAVNGLLPWGQKTGAKSLGEWPALAIMFAERPQVCRTTDGEAVHNLWGVGFYSPSMATFATLTPANPPGLWSTGQVAPAEAKMVRVGRADAVPQPVDFAVPFQVLRSGQVCDPRLPGTPHRAGMNVAMNDGSVRVFAPTTDPWVFWSECAVGPAP